MDIQNSYFLNILKAALNGQQVSLPAELTAEDWQFLAEQAQRHKVLPLICQAAQHSVPAALKSSMRQQVAGQMLRTGQFLSLNRRLQEEGIAPLVVKGIVCRELYPEPDLRLSSDEDLLLPKEQFSQGCSVLEAFGMYSEEQDVEAYERPYRMEGNPLYIELHQSLFDPKSDAFGAWNRFFDGCFSRAVTLNIAGEQVMTLSCTDHLFYLILHAFKHFLHSGFGIRQVCDIVMFANAWGASVDWQTIMENCRQVHAHLFTAAIFRIGEKYLNFDPVKACYPPQWQALSVEEDPLLNDLLSAGIYGGASESRKRSSNITLGAVADRSRGKQAGSSLSSALFPSAKILEGRYPYLKKHRWLLPAAWLDRMLRFGFGKRKADTSAAEALKIGNQRLDLLRQYGVIE